MTYFFYTRSPIGKWIPCTEPDRPSERTPSGGKRKLGRVVKLPEHDRGLPLAMLERLYPNHGETA